MKYTLQELITHQFQSTFTALFPQLATEGVKVEITKSTQPQFGHYQCNTAMRLTKILKRNPRQIAEQVIEGLNGKLFEKLELAGPGFINITLATSFIEELVNECLQSEHLGVAKPVKTQRIVVDFSSPNIAKEMHVGHLRSTIIGDCLCRVLEFLGHDVLRLNHIGDWGTSFGMLISYMQEHFPQELSGEKKANLSDLVSWYKDSKKQFDTDLEFKKRAQKAVVSLQQGEGWARKAWEIICEISREAYEEIYHLLDVKITARGESFYNPLLQGIVEDLDAKGFLYDSGGAKCMRLEGFKNREGEPLPLMLQKSDGGFNYATTDMAAIRQRVEQEKGDRIIYVIDSGQSTHMQMIFQAAQKVGYLDPNHTDAEHVAFGLVLGADGKKFRTRSGETEKLRDLIQKGIQKARSILKERAAGWSEDEMRQVSQNLGVNAIKYADLATHRVGDYTFSYEKMLQFEGNTAVFLMYAYVRIAGIQRKVDRKIEKEERISLVHSSEIALGLHLVQFGETLEKVARELLPNRLAEYLYELAQKFNHFFRDCRVEGVAEEASRLQLCQLTARTLSQGMELLGLRTVARM